MFKLTASVTLGLVLIAGVVAALHFARLDLTLSHYDARAHLMVARRVFDNLTPGWMQLGAVWLPLPHLLNALPVQWDWNYRTGVSGVVLSILPLSIGLAALGGFLAQRTGSMVIGMTVPLVVLLNPNVLYLQSTPMTEPLLFGLSCLALVTVDRWIATPTQAAVRMAGLVLVALMWTRYEGWCITGALLALAAVAHPRQVHRLAVYPAAAAAAFLLLSYGSTGQWFVTSGFFEVTNPAHGRPHAAAWQVIDGAIRQSHPVLMGLGAVGAISIVFEAWRARTVGRAAVAQALTPLSLVAAVALPVYAFASGHPVRIRYSVALVVACMVLCAWALRVLPARARAVGAGLFFASAVLLVPPFDPSAAMVREAQWERPYSEARRAVTAVLAERWDGSPILASMGSLGHYMQQMSYAGFDLRDFLHEGNGDLWPQAEQAPARLVRWMLIEESAEGGDVLAQRARTSPGFLAGFTRIAEGGGVVLYERTR